MYEAFEQCDDDERIMSGFFFSGSGEVDGRRDEFRGICGEEHQRKLHLLEPLKSLKSLKP